MGTFARPHLAVAIMHGEKGDHMHARRPRNVEARNGIHKRQAINSCKESRHALHPVNFKILKRLLYVPESATCTRASP